MTFNSGGAFSSVRRGSGSAVSVTNYNSATRVVSGKALPSASVQVRVNGSMVATVTANAQGLWTHTLAADPNGAIVTAQSQAVSSGIPTPHALPSLPLPVGSRMVAIGDSLLAYSVNAGAPNSETAKICGTYMYGFLDHFRSMDQRVLFDTWFDLTAHHGQNYEGANQGIFGDHMDWTFNNVAYSGGGIANRLKAVLARNPHIVLLQGGSNTINSNDNDRKGTAEYVISQYERMLRDCRMAGVYAIVCTIFPRGDWPASDPRHQEIVRFNAWARTQTGREGVLGVIDPIEDFAPGGVIDPKHYMGDLVHVGQRGGWMVAKKHLLPIIQASVSAGSYFNMDLTVDNLVPVATAKMQGTTGAKTGGATGSVASAASVGINRNLASLTASKEVVSGDTECQVLDLVPNNTSTPAFWQAGFSPTAVTLPNPAAGKWYRFAVKLETIGPASLSTARLNMSLRTASGNVTQASATLQQGFSSDFAASIGDGDRTWWIISNPMRAPDGVVCDRFFWGLEIYGDKTAASSRIKISSPILREMPDPRAAWGYPTA